MTEQPINDDGITEDQLWERLEGQIGSERATTLIDLGFFAFKREDYERALSLADAAVEAAKDAEIDQVLAQAYRSRGVTLNNLGKHEDAAASMKDACSILERFDSLDELCDCYMHVSWNLESAELYDQALVYAEHAERVATECENWNILGRAHWQKADLFLKLNREADVMEQLSLCRQAWRKAENVLGVLDVDDRVSDRFIEEGDHEVAVNLLRDCLDVSSSLKDMPDKAPYFAYALARALRLDGRAAEARAVLEHPLQYNLAMGRMQQLGATYRELASCAADLGEMEEAFSLVGRARAHFDVVGSDNYVLECDQMRAIWLHGEGRYGEAAEVNRSIEMRTEGLRRYWARSRRADNLRAAGDFSAAIALIEDEEQSGTVEVPSAAWFWRQSILTRVLDRLGRTEQAESVAVSALGMDASSTSAATQAVLHEFRGNWVVRTNELEGQAEWSRAVALYLAANCPEDAQRLSSAFLSARNVGNEYTGA